MRQKKTDYVKKNLSEEERKKRQEEQERIDKKMFHRYCEQLRYLFEEEFGLEMNPENTGIIWEKLKLEGGHLKSLDMYRAVYKRQFNDRASKKNWCNYMTENRHYFKDLFGKPPTDNNVQAAYQQVRGIMDRMSERGGFL